MGWNPYTDQKNSAFVSILTGLFPEQTKTLPRIIVWSLIFFAELVLGVVGAVHYGLIQFENYSNQSQLSLAVGLLVVAIIAVFWLQGKIFYGIAKLFR
jgi:hypothetical protein